MAHHRVKSSSPLANIRDSPRGPHTSYCPMGSLSFPEQASSHCFDFAQRFPGPGVPFPPQPGETLCLLSPALLSASLAAALGSTVSQLTLFTQETELTLPF